VGLITRERQNGRGGWVVFVMAVEGEGKR
jgi:hypothetical protein